MIKNNCLLEKAKFIGTDGSLGLRKNHTYMITFIPSNSYSLMIKIWEVNRYCAYDSLGAFLKNWEVNTFIPSIPQCEPIRSSSPNFTNNKKFIHK